MKDESTIRELYQFWMRILNKLNESEKLPRNFGIQELMTPSDIHVLKAVGDHPESNVRTIAEILGITPGAASQQLSKLSKRGLITKVRGVKNEKEVYLKLTTLGNKAYQNHEIVHEMVYQRLINRIGPLNYEEIQLLNRILHAMESVYDERIIEVKKSLSMHQNITRPDFSEMI